MGGQLPYVTPLKTIDHLLHIQGKYEEARTIYERSLAIRETVLGPDHPDVAGGFNDLAALWACQVSIDSVEYRVFRD